MHYSACRPKKAWVYLKLLFIVYNACRLGVFGVFVFSLPADIWEALALLIPVCQLAVPVDGPGADANVPLPGDCGAGVGCLTPPCGVQNPTKLC